MELEASPSHTHISMDHLAYSTAENTNHKNDKAFFKNLNLAMGEFRHSGNICGREGGTEGRK